MLFEACRVSTAAITVLSASFDNSKLRTGCLNLGHATLDVLSNVGWGHLDCDYRNLFISVFLSRFFLAISVSRSSLSISVPNIVEMRS